MRSFRPALRAETFASGSGAPAPSSTASRTSGTAGSLSRSRSGSRSISSRHELTPLSSRHAEVGLHRGAFRGFVLTVEVIFQCLGNGAADSCYNRDIRSLQGLVCVRTDIARQYGLNVVIRDGLGSLDSRAAPGGLRCIGYRFCLSTVRIDNYEVLSAAESRIYLGTLIVSTGANCYYFHFFSYDFSSRETGSDALPISNAFYCSFVFSPAWFPTPRDAPGPP